MAYQIAYTQLRAIELDRRFREQDVLEERLELEEAERRVHARR